MLGSERWRVIIGERGVVGLVGPSKMVSLVNESDVWLIDYV